MKNILLFARLGLFALASAACLQGISQKSIWLVLLGATMSAVAFLGVKDIPPAERKLPVPFSLRALLADRFRLFVALAIIFTVVAMAIVELVPNNLPAVLPWILAMLCMVGAGYSHDRKLTHADVSASDKPKFSFRHLSSDAKLELILALALTIAAFAFRYYNLENSPPTVHVDEGEMGMFGLDILAGKPVPFFYTAPFWGLPLIFNYLQAGTMALFGSDIIGIRMLSALTGALCIPAIYGVAREGWGKTAAFVAAALMLVSHYHIHYSRIAIICIQTQLGMLIFAWLMARAANNKDGFGGKVISRGGILIFILTGMALGLSQYFYFGSRVMPFYAIVWLGYLLIGKKINLKQAAAVFIAAAIIYLPLAVFFVHHVEMFTGRVEFVSIFRTENYKALLGPNTQLPADILKLMQYQLEHILGFFINLGDGGSFYNPSFAAFDSITVLLMWLGVGAAITKARRYHEFSLLVWFLLGLVMGGLFTIDAPSGQRLLIVTPVVYLFAGVFAQKFAAISSRAFGRIGQIAIVAASIALIFAAASKNIETYFVTYPKIAAGYEGVYAAREFMTDPAGYKNYLLAAPVMYSNHGAIKYLARDAQVGDLLKADDLKQLPEGKGVAIVTMQNHYNDLKAIQARFP